MICPKCGRKYEDDMPKCLWCDAPNPGPEAAPSCKQDATTDENTQNGNQENKPAKGTLIFWMGALFGELGIHCFISGRPLRGCIYLLFGGFVFGFIQGFFGAFGVHFPVGLHMVMGFISIAIAILACIDIWKISSGKYTNIKTGVPYKGKTWMIVITILVYIVTGLIILGNITSKVKTGFLNPESYESKPPIQKNAEDAEKIANAIEAYALKQELFFESNKQLGSFEEIGFEQNSSLHFDVQDLGMGISVRYKSFLGCTNGSIWSYSASIQDDNIVWYFVLPKDGKCRETFPKLYELKEKLKNQQPNSDIQ